MAAALPHDPAPRTRPARVRRPAVALAATLAALLSSACFATRNDVRVLQTDIATLRAERAFGDSARAAQIDRIIGQMRVATDSLRALAVQSSRFQGDAREALRNLQEAIITVQELTGQSQRRLQELRASMEAQQASAVAAAPAAGAGDSAAAPGPNQLYQLALDQYQRGSFGTARAGFEDLLRRYATADVAADAQYYVTESFAAERNTGAADTAYAAVVTRYPTSPRAALALYKRGRLRQSGGRPREARPLYEELIRRYPKSDEAALAREALKALPAARP